MISEWIVSNFLEVIAILISVIAVIISFLKELFLPIIMKPKISIEGINDNICVENATDSKDRKSRWVRLRLKNEKTVFSIPAKKCYVKLIFILKNEKKVSPLNSFPLMWVYYGKELKHDLAIGEDHLIDLVYEHQDNKHLNFTIPISYELLKDADKKLGPGKYTFKVGVYGDNFEPIFEEFKVKFTSKFGEINFDKNDDKK